MPCLSTCQAYRLEPTLNHYGYLAVVGLVLIEDFGFPVPGETVLILAAVYAATGRLNIVLVALLGLCGAFSGDNLGFAIGHFGGHQLAERYGRYTFLTPERLDKAIAFFDRHGGKIIIVARFIEGLRQANGVIAGTTGMRWARFVIFNAIGAALWVVVWTGVGYSPAATSTRSTPTRRGTTRTSRSPSVRSCSHTSRDTWRGFDELKRQTGPETRLMWLQRQRRRVNSREHLNRLRDVRDDRHRRSASTRSPSAHVSGCSAATAAVSKRRVETGGGLQRRHGYGERT